MSWKLKSEKFPWLIIKEEEEEEEEENEKEDEETGLFSILNCSTYLVFSLL